MCIADIVWICHWHICLYMIYMLLNLFSNCEGAGSSTLWSMTNTIHLHTYTRCTLHLDWYLLKISAAFSVYWSPMRFNQFGYCSSRAKQSSLRVLSLVTNVWSALRGVSSGHVISRLYCLCCSSSLVYRVKGPDNSVFCLPDSVEQQSVRKACLIYLHLNI